MKRSRYILAVLVLAIWGYSVAVFGQETEAEISSQEDLSVFESVTPGQVDENDVLPSSALMEDASRESGMPVMSDVSISGSTETLSETGLASPENVSSSSPQIVVRAIELGVSGPEFSLPEAISGQLADPRVGIDEFLVLLFFRGAWDPYAQEQLKSVMREYKGFENLGAKVVGISGDDQEKLATFRKSELFPFPILVDADFNVGRLYGTYRPEMRQIYPACFILDRAGRIRFFQRASLGPETVEVQEILRALGNLQNDKWEE